MLISNETKSRLEHYFAIGSSGTKWYQHTRSAAQQRFGNDADHWLAFFALTSPNATVKANVTLATKALWQWDKGEEFEGYLTTVKDSLEHYRKTFSIQGESRKVKAFHSNLQGDLNPITVDRWISRAAGLKKNPRTAEQYASVALPIKELSWRMRVEPAEAQAAIWAGVQLEQGIAVDCTSTLIMNVPKERQQEIWH